jgi:ABC-2 type transport system permease protein
MSFRKYLEIARIGFREATAYRFDALMSVATSGFFLVLYYYIWSAIAASGQLSSSLTQIMSYIVVGQIVSNSVFVDAESFIGEKVRQGTIVNELKRPISLRLQTYFYLVGKSSFNLISRGLPVWIIGALFLNVGIPSGMNLLGFILSLFLSMNLVFSLSYATSMLVFWTKVAWSLRMMRSLIQNLFSGVVFPLYLLPTGLQPIFDFLPFSSMADGPISIFQGQVTGWGMLNVFAEQIGWTIAILLLGEVMWRKAKQKLTVQGG